MYRCTDAGTRHAYMTCNLKAKAVSHNSEDFNEFGCQQDTGTAMQARLLPIPSEQMLLCNKVFLTTPAQHPCLTGSHPGPPCTAQSEHEAHSYIASKLGHEGAWQWHQDPCEWELDINSSVTTHIRPAHAKHLLAQTMSPEQWPARADTPCTCVASERTGQLCRKA